MTRKRYEHYIDSGEAWLGSYPSHWHKKPLWTLFRRVKRLGFEDEELLSVYRDHGVIPKSSREDNFNKPSDDLGAYQLVEVGDLAVNKMKAWQGSVAISGHRGIVSPAYHVYAPLHSENPRFFHYLMRCDRYITGYLSVSKGIRVNQWDLQPEYHSRMPILVPPFEEQGAIATFLDRETAKIDALIAEQQRLIELLQEKRQAVISLAVTKGLNPDAPMKDSGVEWLGEVPEHWRVMQLNKLINKITNGYVGPTRDILVDEGVRYLQSLHIKGNRIIFETPYYVSSEWSLSKEKSILRAGDVLIVQTGDIGQSAVVTNEFEGCNCHALIVVGPREVSISGDWLSWVLNSTYGRETLLSIQTGALHPHLNCGSVKYIQGTSKNSSSARADQRDPLQQLEWMGPKATPGPIFRGALQIPVAPKDEQSAICKHIQIKNAEFDRLISAASSSINLMQERRSALISAAVTGQIDVRGLVADEAAAA